MIKYWKVHKNDIKYFPNISQGLIDVFNDVCLGQYDYLANNYIYIIVDDMDMPNSFMPYENHSILYFKTNLYEFAGDFKTIKDIRKEKLNKLTHGK